LRRLVELAKHRWVVERDDLQWKQELGAGPRRGPLVARRSSSRHTLHGSVWVPGGREEPNFGLSTLGKARAQSAATAGRIPAAGERENEDSALSHSRSPVCASGWRRPSLGSFPAALFAGPDVYDPVVLGTSSSGQRLVGRLSGLWRESAGQWRLSLRPRGDVRSWANQCVENDTSVAVGFLPLAAPSNHAVRHGGTGCNLQRPAGEKPDDLAQHSCAMTARLATGHDSPPAASKTATTAFRRRQQLAR
jgi:hypothetical protein